ncbi:ubiquinone biosynthesis protein COQ7-domain-containing protein [Tribonema minus]|uniref:Ubiquinone biosynthesis protein COQ7-domain-containing protein n=1 Tax=Tribonema minus TaxID=303371 RepID=A0A835ZB49_9STRA|nr:ubiquinone biosynthesis protein COQ7-domain-containing protein [Tribonema minus]
MTSLPSRPQAQAAAAPTSEPAVFARFDFNWQALFAERISWLTQPNVVADLRSDHAGETGAVYIYLGAAWAMALSPQRYTPGAHSFVTEHCATEEGHLALFDRLLPREHHSKLLLAWKAAGFALGALPTLVGEAALFCTVESVETFVEEHYNEHIVPMEREGAYPELVRLLRHCRDDEVHHKNDAAARWGAPAATASGSGESGDGGDSGGSGGGGGSARPWYGRAWAAVVGRGSKAAVAVCRRV